MLRRLSSPTKHKDSITRLTEIIHNYQKSSKIKNSDRQSQDHYGLAAAQQHVSGAGGEQFKRLPTLVPNRNRNIREQEID
jgi:hypothetical protein